MTRLPRSLTRLPRSLRTCRGPDAPAAAWDGPTDQGATLVVTLAAALDEDLD